MIIEGGNDALRLDINVDRYGKPVKVRDLRNLILRVTHHQCVIIRPNRINLPSPRCQWQKYE